MLHINDVARNYILVARLSGPSVLFSFSNSRFIFICLASAEDFVWIKSSITQVEIEKSLREKHG